MKYVLIYVNAANVNPEEYQEIVFTARYRPANIN